MPIHDYVAENQRVWYEIYLNEGTPSRLLLVYTMSSYFLHLYHLKVTLTEVWCPLPASEVNCIIEHSEWLIDLPHFVWLPDEHPRTLLAWPTPESAAATSLTVKIESHSSRDLLVKKQLGCLFLNRMGEVRLDEGLWAHSAPSEPLPFER